MTTRAQLSTVAGAAMLIAGITLVARAVGFGRWLVYSHSVGTNCLGTAYTTANMLPNIVFEVVAGGALASAVVPLVAGQLARGDVDAVRRTSSALLTWALLVLVPLAVVAILAAGPLMSFLVGDPARCDAPAVRRVAAEMFVVFAPQMPLYGIAVVCGGVLNAHRRYLGAAVAPLVSSVVVVATYWLFGRMFHGTPSDVSAVPSGDRALLSVGTTVGVVALALAMAVPVLRLRLGLRPTLRFPEGVSRQARSLASAGIAGLVAQQIASLAVIRLSNTGGGLLNVYTYAWAVFLLPYAVLAVPVATSAFTALSEHAGRNDTDAFAAVTATTTRAVVLVSLLGAGLLAGTAVPVARTFMLGRDVHLPPWTMTWSLVAFAPALLGYGLLAHLSRVLYARGAGRVAATATAAGWLTVAAVAIPLALAVPGFWTVTAIAAAHSVGLLLSAGLLVAALVRTVGGAALVGSSRALVAGVGGALAASAAGLALARLLPTVGAAGSAAEAVLAAVVTAGCFGVVVLAVDGDDLRALLRRRFSRA